MIVAGYVEHLSLVGKTKYYETCSDNSMIWTGTGLSATQCKQKCDETNGGNNCNFFLSYYVPLLKNMVCSTYSSCDPKKSKYIIAKSFGATYRKQSGK